MAKGVVITDPAFMADVRSLKPTDLIAKYREIYKYFTHTELKFENGYALIPDNYQEIYRSWYVGFFEKENGDKVKYTAISRVKDGQRRRKKLYVAALIMKMILPSRRDTLMNSCLLLMKHIKIKEFRRLMQTWRNTAIWQKTALTATALMCFIRPTIS